jgi:predicted dithiol-disulfide oxidoreductase (DUF899 family)
MEALMGVTFPNESPEYRAARDKLVQREVSLRREMEGVAAEIRALPQGGAVPEDYEFDHIDAKGAPAKVRLSEMFRPRTDTLIIYHYMFPRHRSDKRRGPSSGPTAQLPLEEGPCPSCTALLDNWEGAIPHVEGLGVNIAAVAKAPIERVAAFATDRGWRNLKLLSAANNSFKRDYHGEDDEGQQVPILTVFHKGPDGVIRLSWASETVVHADRAGAGSTACRYGRADVDPPRPYSRRTTGRERADRIRACVKMNVHFRG